jgi:hypothetical protein
MITEAPSLRISFKSISILWSGRCTTMSSSSSPLLLLISLDSSCELECYSSSSSSSSFSEDSYLYSMLLFNAEVGLGFVMKGVCYEVSIIIEVG